MQAIVDIRLDNEMDLILAHKRTMKLAELCGLSLSVQTTFATAVSELARSAIAHGNRSNLCLGIRVARDVKDITATLTDQVDLRAASPEAIRYATKLNGNLESNRTSEGFELILSHRIPFPGTISNARTEQFKAYFMDEPPLSPYDEIRKKNIQLIELTNKLSESEKQYRTLTDTLPLMMFALCLNGEVTYSNKWLSDHLAVASQLNISAWKSLFHKDDYQLIDKGWENSQMNKVPFRAQARLWHKASNSYIWHLINILPTRNEYDEVTGYIGFFVDIHAQKVVEETLKDNRELRETQEELRRYQKELENKIAELNASNHDLEQFAYIASHDLQEPLRKIKTFTGILQKSLDLEGKQKEYFNKIMRSSERMSSLIRDVLDYSRLSKPEGQFTETDLNKLIDHIQYDFELMIQEKRARVLIENKLPVIYGVRQQLEQAFSNLLSNALKFSESDPVIHISSRTVAASEIPMPEQDHDPQKAFYEITFRDEGIGFEPKYAEQIFTIFQRLNHSGSFSGTGIGLAMCRKIMSNHEGFITAESTLGEGAVFRMYFPVKALS